LAGDKTWGLQEKKDTLERDGKGDGGHIPAGSASPGCVETLTTRSSGVLAYMYQALEELELPQEVVQGLDLAPVGLELDLVRVELGQVFSLVVESDQAGLEAMVDKDLEGSDLEGSDLEVSDQEGSDPEVSDLEGSDLEGSGLEGSDLEGSGLEESDLEGSDQEGSGHQTLVQAVGAQHLCLVVLGQVDTVDAERDRELGVWEEGLVDLDQVVLVLEAMELDLVELVQVVMDKLALVQVAKAQDMEALEQEALVLVGARELELVTHLEVVWEHHLVVPVMGLVELGLDLVVQGLVLVEQVLDLVGLVEQGLGLGEQDMGLVVQGLGLVELGLGLLVQLAEDLELRLVAKHLNKFQALGCLDSIKEDSSLVKVLEAVVFFLELLQVLELELRVDQEYSVKVAQDQEEQLMAVDNSYLECSGVTLLYHQNQDQENQRNQEKLQLNMVELELEEVVWVKEEL
ncbi:unnamed protein product, partial [Menidia menidia]